MYSNEVERGNAAGHALQADSHAAMGTKSRAHNILAIDARQEQYPSLKSYDEPTGRFRRHPTQADEGAPCQPCTHWNQKQGPLRQDVVRKPGRKGAVNPQAHRNPAFERHTATRSLHRQGACRLARSGIRVRKAVQNMGRAGRLRRVSPDTCYTKPSPVGRRGRNGSRRSDPTPRRFGPPQRPSSVLKEKACRERAGRRQSAARVLRRCRATCMPEGAEVLALAWAERDSADGRAAGRRFHVFERLSNRSNGNGADDIRGERNRKTRDPGPELNSTLR